jgi:hypothetical protein
MTPSEVAMSPELNKKYIKKTMVSERSSWDWTIQKMCRGSGLGVFQPGCVLYIRQMARPCYASYERHITNYR